MTAKTLQLGPVMLDIPGISLGEADRARLLHPHTGGVILFKRNYVSPDQIAELTAQIRALRSPQLLIAVDHEGGRVQRFQNGYTAIPAMAELGTLWNGDRAAARRCSEAAGFVIAAELAVSGIDFSFTPVLDLDFGRSAVIGDRAFHRDATAVSELAAALIAGLSRGGLAAVGKHFPGHGFVAEDSHLEIPVDRRTLTELCAADLVPYQRLASMLGGVMPAHVIYPEVDGAPAGFSRVWLQRILREGIGFDGLIFSDDLSMEGAAIAGGIVERGQAALSAGCDLVLVCNRPDLADQLLAGITWEAYGYWEDRVTRMRARRAYTSLEEVRADSLFQTALAELHLSIVAVTAVQPPCA